MKKLFVALLCLTSMTVFAQIHDGSSCERAFEIGDEFSAVLPEGDFWFVAETPSLPLTVYFYKTKETDDLPDVWLDLTCTPGEYNDPIIQNLIDKAGEYDLTFPMHEKLKKTTDDFGRECYYVSFNENYRNMLYTEGVTYAIKAYMHIQSHAETSVDFVSTSVESQCRDFVNTFTMNSAMRIEPEDSVNVYVWPIGEWINTMYRITWEDSEGNLAFYDGMDCMIEKNRRVRTHRIMPKEEIVMNTKTAKDIVKEINNTNLYVRLYADKPGILRIESFEEKLELVSILFGKNGDCPGVPGVIDNETMTITCVAPSRTTCGWNLRQILNHCADEGSIVYNAYNGELPIVKDGKLQLGDLVYTLNVTQASDPGSTDATIKAIELNGELLVQFNPAILEYIDVESVLETPALNVILNNANATYKVSGLGQIPCDVTITVTAELGNTLEYVLHLIAARSTDATLKTLTVNGFEIEGFSPDELYYRQTAVNVPVIGAEANDPKAKVTIDQPKRLPGFAQVFVEAEAGNVTIYSITFSEDPKVKECAEVTPAIALNEPKTLKKGMSEAIALPTNTDILINSEDEQVHSEKLNLRFNWSGNSSVTMYVSSLCQLDLSKSSTTLLATYDIQKPHGETEFHLDWNNALRKQLSQKSVDGNLYLFFFTAEEGGAVTITSYEETCLTRSNFVDFGEMEVSRSMLANLYKIYYPDWKDKDITMTWEGDAAMDMFLATSCDFYLVDNDTRLLAPAPFKFAAGTSEFVLNPTITSAWADNTDNGFLYVRFKTNGSGLLKLTVTDDHSHETALANTDSGITCYANNVQLFVKSNQNDNLIVFNALGQQVLNTAINEGVLYKFDLPQGLYVVRTQTGAKKVQIR